MWLEELAKPILFSQTETLTEKWRLGAGMAEMNAAVGNSWKTEAGQAWSLSLIHISEPTRPKR